jgi:major type 1 subunit fimbrin (pilin)
MKFKIKQQGLALALTCAILSPLNALAFDGTITFQGNITNGTCAVSTTGGSADMAVMMPNTPSSALARAGATSQTISFSINLSKCSADMFNNVSAYFQSPNTNSATGNLKNTVATGGATNVEVQILDRSVSPINLTFSPEEQYGSSSGTSRIVNGAAVMNYGARYIATGPIKPGLLTTSTNYTVIYW